MTTIDGITIDLDEQENEQDTIEYFTCSSILDTLDTSIEIIDGVGFRLESSACPLQYGLYKDGVKIGYYYERGGDIICEISSKDKETFIKIPALDELSETLRDYHKDGLNEDPNMPKEYQEEIQNEINKILSDRLSTIPEAHHTFATDIFNLGLKQATANLVNKAV